MIVKVLFPEKSSHNPFLSVKKKLTSAEQNRLESCVMGQQSTEQMTKPSTDDTYEALIAANAEVAVIILPKKWKRKGIDLETPDLIHARNLFKTCAVKNRMKFTTSPRANLQSAKKVLDKVYSKQLDQQIST